MIGKKVTLAVATATKVVDGAPGSRSVLVKTALTDLVIGGPGVTSATGYPFAAAVVTPGATVPIGSDDLWAISAAGGDIFLAYPENG